VLNTKIPQSYTINFLNPPAHVPSSTTVFPYQNASGFYNPQGYQIISAGRDSIFGSSGLLPPSSSWGFDDQSNFSKTVLGGGIN
jgi:hypothetical protein